MSIAMSVSTVGELQTVQVVVNGELYVAANTHPNFKEIKVRAAQDDESVVQLFDVSKTVAEKFENLSERVSVKGGRVYFDREEITTQPALTAQIVNFLTDGEDFGCLVNFYEKLMSNPNEHSREQLFRWLDTHKFTITPDGDIVGYKGVNVDSDGVYRSIHSGPAIVTELGGEPTEVNGYVPNMVGSVIEMPRGDVTFDPGHGCSTGLHVGTWAYARDFSRNTVLEVHVNPRDVVSVPSDCNDAKMRTCRYVVVGVVEEAYTTSVKWDSGYGDEDDSDYNQSDWDEDDE